MQELNVPEQSVDPAVVEPAPVASAETMEPAAAAPAERVESAVPVEPAEPVESAAPVEAAEPAAVETIEDVETRREQRRRLLAEATQRRLSHVAVVPESPSGADESSIDDESTAVSFQSV